MSPETHRAHTADWSMPVGNTYCLTNSYTSWTLIRIYRYYTQP